MDTYLLSPVLCSSFPRPNFCLLWVGRRALPTPVRLFSMLLNGWIGLSGVELVRIMSSTPQIPLARGTSPETIERRILRTSLDLSLLALSERTAGLSGSSRGLNFTLLALLRRKFSLLKFGVFVQLQ